MRLEVPFPTKIFQRFNVRFKVSRVLEKQSIFVIIYLLHLIIVSRESPPLKPKGSILFQPSQTYVFFLSLFFLFFFFLNVSSLYVLQDFLYFLLLFSLWILKEACRIFRFPSCLFSPFFYTLWVHSKSESSEFYVDRGRNRVVEGDIRYRSDCSSAAKLTNSNHPLYLATKSLGFLGYATTPGCGQVGFTSAFLSWWRRTTGPSPRRLAPGIELGTPRMAS